ncbi:MAG: hypothetical protein HKO59_02930 [Phycisphaerales bacterium]|nr:hypothetical protein [Phycisphaerae bacterium]NNM24936.1 hypothetical protein [Phycisphaerales bacterium]
MPTIDAAIALWEQIAAFAWEGNTRHGRGVVLVEERELQEAAATFARGETPTLTPTYFPASGVPRGDDFSGVLNAYDPAREVMLLVKQPDGSETLLALHAAGEERPTPERCFAQRRARGV